MDQARAELMDWSADNTDDVFQPQAAHIERWYKGEHFHRLPDKPALRREGLDAVLQGWRPSSPIIDASTRVLAFGSCFASYFIAWLGDNGFNRRSADSPYNMLVRYNQAFENAAVIAQQFRWAFEEMDSSQAFWVDRDAQVIQVTDEQRQLVKGSLQETDVLIVTLGLSEIWFDRHTGEPLWRTIPLERFDADRHAFKVLNVSDTVAALETIERLRASHLPNLKIVYTVSPVRLRATFRPVSALTANSESKAIIRAAVGEFLRTHWDQVGTTYFYFPSYELVLDVFREPFEQDNQHIYPSVVAQVLALFARWYTRLPVDSEPSPMTEAHLADTELYHHIASLEARNAALQQICDDRQRVIEQLDQAARERLDLVSQLDAACKAYQQALRDAGLPEAAGDR